MNLTLPNINPGVGVGTNPPSYGLPGIGGQTRRRAELLVQYSTADYEYLVSRGRLHGDAGQRHHVELPGVQPGALPVPARLSESVHGGRAVGAGLAGGLCRGERRRGLSAMDLRRGFLERMRNLQPGVGHRSDRDASLETLSPIWRRSIRLDGGGDRIGHSTYHALLVKYNKRLGNGLTIQASYTFSKLLTDTDGSYAAASYYGDMYNLRLLKSIASFDQTHPVKLT